MGNPTHPADHDHHHRGRPVLRHQCEDDEGEAEEQRGAGLVRRELGPGRIGQPERGGDRPGGGISLPEWYNPWPAITNRNMYLPGTEILPKNEMRVTFLGSSPWPPNPLQKGTSMLVELGNDTSQPRRFFFDLGNGSVGHAIALQVPAPFLNDIFHTSPLALNELLVCAALPFTVLVLVELEKLASRKGWIYDFGKQS